MYFLLSTSHEKLLSDILRSGLTAFCVLPTMTTGDALSIKNANSDIAPYGYFITLCAQHVADHILVENCIALDSVLVEDHYAEVLMVKVKG